jgi:hypothetical protein
VNGEIFLPQSTSRKVDEPRFEATMEAFLEGITDQEIGKQRAWGRMAAYGPTAGSDAPRGI